MRVTFRVDASIRIGSGHVMRCLTLADALTKAGAECHFLCGEQAGDLLDIVRGNGHIVHVLSRHEDSGGGGDWPADAERSYLVLDALRADWLVLDHYGLGEDWERKIRPAVGKLMVIDDIGRPHLCDLLLDQNFPNPTHDRYEKSAIGGALLLLGPQYALVRPEFAALRSFSLNRRDGSLRRLLVSMGGSDPDDETSKVLTAVSAGRTHEWTLDIVVGAANPHRRSVETACAELPNARLHVQTPQMADLMAAADCAITTGGSISWERCTLGLPAIVTAVSVDQLAVSEALADEGAQVFLGWNSKLTAAEYASALESMTALRLRQISTAAAAICDGRGAERVVERLHS